jgi:hypothetical protein
VTNDYHRQCRAFVAALIEADRVATTPPAGLKDIYRVYEQDEFDDNDITGPAVVCYLMAQAAPVGGTMQRDDWKIPIVVGYKTTGVPSGNQAGPHPTVFLGAIQDLFHNRRPAGVPSGVYRIEIDPQGQTATNEEKYQQLRAATTVVLTARLPRRG